MSFCIKNHQTAKAKTLAYLKNYGFNYIGWELSQESSDVIGLRTPEHRLLAVKIKAANDEILEELSLWRYFHHRNILPLLYNIRLKDLHLMFMPICIDSLQHILMVHRNNKIGILGIGNRLTFRLVLSWIRDIADGLAHLHAQGVCHLNLQASNILIGMDKRALLGGFGCVRKTTRPVTNYGLPIEYSPPECWACASRSPVLGHPYDLWSLGMLAFNIWTDYSLENKVDGKNDWKKDVYPHLFNALQFQNFRVRIRRVFPDPDLNYGVILKCRNFLYGLLHRDPGQRADTARVLRHPSMPGGERMCPEFWFGCDPIWITYHDEHSGEWDSSISSIESRETDASEVSEESLSAEKFSQDSWESGVSSKASNQTGVRRWLRKKWSSVKAFFCRKKTSN